MFLLCMCYVPFCVVLFGYLVELLPLIIETQCLEYCPIKNIIGGGDSFVQKAC